MSPSSTFEIGEARPGRPAKPDPFSGLRDIFTQAQVGAALTVPIAGLDGLTDEQKRRIALKAKGALKRYAKEQGGLAGEVGFTVLEGAVELWFTKRKARQVKPAEGTTATGGEPGSPATGEAPFKPNRKRAAAGAEQKTE